MIAFDTNLLIPPSYNHSDKHKICRATKAKETKYIEQLKHIEATENFPLHLHCMKHYAANKRLPLQITWKQDAKVGKRA